LNGVITVREILWLLAATAVVQSVFANYLPSGLYVDFPLVFALYIGWYSPPVRGAIAGTAFGWMQDAIVGIFLGMNGMSKTLIGFGGSYLSKLLVLESFLARCFLISILSLLNNLFILGLGLMVGQTIGRGVWLRTLIQVPATGLVGGIVFVLYDRIKFPEKDFRQL
jgi:rod shape-determining protein MreD